MQSSSDKLAVPKAETYGSSVQGFVIGRSYLNNAFVQWLPGMTERPPYSRLLELEPNGMRCCIRGKRLTLGMGAGNGTSEQLRSSSRMLIIKPCFHLRAATQMSLHEVQVAIDESSPLESLSR